MSKVFSLNSFWKDNKDTNKAYYNNTNQNRVSYLYLYNRGVRIVFDTIFLAHVYFEWLFYYKISENLETQIIMNYNSCQESISI